MSERRRWWGRGVWQELGWVVLAALLWVLLPWGLPQAAGNGDPQPEPARQTEQVPGQAALQEALAEMARADPDWPSVHQALRQAAHQGSLPAKSYLGWLYETGGGVPRDLAQAAEWYVPVAAAGVTRFAIKLGWLYLQPDLGPDRAQSEAWFQRAIAADSDDARVALASVWVADAQGGDARRLEEAHALLEAAMAGGHPTASRFLARIHVESIGNFPATDASRLAYTRRAAADGHALMQGWLAQRYVDGDGVAQDLEVAAFWAALAAAEGDPLGAALHPQLQAQIDEAARQRVLERTLQWALGSRS